MNRTMTAVMSTLLLVGALAGGAWWAGWLHVGAMAMRHAAPETTAEGADEHAGHAAPDAAAQDPDTHAGHDGHDAEGHDAEGQDTDEHAGHSAPAMVDHSEHEGMTTEGAMDAAMDMPEGAVMISPERQQLIGVRTATVLEEDIVRRIRTVGRVDYDETRVAHIHTRVTGWIEQLHVDFTGKLVEAGQPLLEIYSPELVATQEEYLLALRAQESLGESPFEEVAMTTRSLLEATRRRLLLWDVTEAQIAALEERREPETRLALYSPIEGFVIHKNAYEGQHVGPDSELFTIADLSTVWIMADVYESDLPLVREGQQAMISLSYQPGRTYVGVVDYIYPYLAGETRTATVRLVLSNTEAQLKPDMYANVEISSQLGRSLVVPEDAVIDTGERQVVFIVLPGGHFLAREVRVGARFDDLLQIVEGLEAGETVVSGAAFLIDSESKLRSAVGGMAGHQH